MGKLVYTIGHSNHDIDSFVALLKKFNIQVLVDIRSQPYSSYVRHFNKEVIKNHLHKHGIDYFYGGNQLGGKPQDETLYVDGKLNIDLMRKNENYQKGMHVLKKLIAIKNVVLMCAEEDPEKCHRNRIVSTDLVSQGFEVKHIRGDGSVQDYNLVAEPKQNVIIDDLPIQPKTP